MFAPPLPSLVRAQPSPAAALLAVAVALAIARGASLPAQGAPNASILAPDPSAKVAGGPLAPAFARARAAVVRVLVEIEDRNTFAIERPSSGVVLTGDGLVVTHWDLVREADHAAGEATDKAVFVQFGAPASRRLPARIVGHDQASGLALLQVELPAGDKLQAIALAAEPQPGDPAMVVSLHDGEDYVAFAGVLTPALADITAGSGDEARRWARADVWLTDAAILERSHGAALVSATGGLLGLCSAVCVVPQVAEPTLAELKRPSFGFVVPTRILRRAFPSACAKAASEPVVRSVEAGVAAAVAASVVAVYGGDGTRPALGDDDPYGVRRRPGVGSGVVVDGQGLVLTSSHLVAGRDTATVTLADGSTCTAEVAKRDARTNTALLRLQLTGRQQVTPLPYARLDDVAVGQRLLVVGFPDANALTVRAGVLSAKRGSVVQVDAGIGNHNSGGAIVTLDGLLVGIADAGASDPIDVAFAHRGDKAKVDASLDLSPSLDLLRQVYRPALDRAGDDTARATPAPTPAPKPGRDAAAGSVAAVVERTAGCLLNVYVQITTAAAELDDNPFAEAAGKTMTEGLGSGVVIDPSGLALTNWHVVDSATLPDGSMQRDRVVRASLRDGRSFAVTVLSISREEDLALLQLHLESGETVDAITLGESASLSVGDQAIAVGNPLGRANTVTVGVVSAKNQSIRVRGRWRKLPHLLETDAAINAGNSGGALLDAEGRLIGINSAGGSLRAVTGFAIGVDHVRRKLQSLLLSCEKLRSPYVGLAVFDRDGKVVVQAVDRYGPAAAAGIEVGDVVSALAGEPVRWSVGWALAWRQVTAGTPIAVDLGRAGQPLRKEVVSWSAPTWAAYRQTGLQMVDLGLADDPDTVRAAALAATRRFSHDPTAAPRELPASLVRVASVHPEVAAKVDVRAGDIFLGVIWREAGHTGDAGRLERFTTVAEAQRFFNQQASYDGETFEVWLCRDGVVHVATLLAKRLPW